MDSELELLRRVFLAESEDGLAAMEEALVDLESRPSDPEPVASIFRIVHTMKGGAAMVGADSVAELAHLLEDALALFRTGIILVTPAHVTVMLQTVDVLRGLLGGVADGTSRAVTDADRALVARLIPAELQQRAGEEMGASLEDLETEELIAPMMAAVSAGPSPLPADAPAKATLGTRARMLRVDMGKLDALLTLTSEIAVARGQLMEEIGVQRTTTATGGTASAAEELDRLLGSLQDQVTQLRLVPLGPTFRNHLRTVRDVASQQSKLARLEVEGEDVEVDASVVDHLRDPLTHMIRNAIDHGLEYPAARLAAGKDPCGTITLRARHEHGTVMIEVSDDGAGIDRDKVIARARGKGLLDSDAAPSDADVFRLLTMPGFSTADQVTELSGRGVGMDVVRRNVEALRGTLTISSTLGSGTTVAARLPLTLAIIQGFGVSVGSETFVLPLDAISECIQLPRGHQADGARGGLVNLRDTPLPFVRLRHLLGVGGSAPARENIVVVQHDGRRLGIAVDRLYGQSETVIKPLGDLFRGTPGVIGSTILGNGRVALILDVPVLLEQAAAAAKADGFALEGAMVVPSRLALAS